MSSALLLHRPALLCSPTGCGKSAVARAVLYGAHASQTLRRSWEIRAAEVLLGSHSTAGEVRSCVDRWFGRRTAGARKAFHTEAQALRVRWSPSHQPRCLCGPSAALLLRPISHAAFASDQPRCLPAVICPWPPLWVSSAHMHAGIFHLRQRLGGSRRCCVSTAACHHKPLASPMVTRSGAVLGPLARC